MSLDKAKYTPGMVVNYFLEKSALSQSLLTHLQLQKLVYFSHAWYIAFNSSDKENIKPFINEPFEAWKLGPVCSSVYHEYKGLGARPIEAIPSNFMKEWDLDSFDLLERSIPEWHITERKLLDSVWNAYSNYSGPQLSEMTHYQNPAVETPNPWSKAWKKAEDLGIDKGYNIKNSDIYEYFSKLRALRSKY